MIAISDGSHSKAMLELERLLIAQAKVQLVRFERAEPFLEFMQDLISLPPHFVLIEANHDGLDCLEQLRSLETGRTLSTIMLASDLNSKMLERARKYHATSCVSLPSDTTTRFEVFTALVTYWCSINEPAN
jgi:AmiR/NasT family two-component response regulator